MKKLHSIFLEPTWTNGIEPLVLLNLSEFCYSISLIRKRRYYLNF